ISQTGIEGCEKMGPLATFLMTPSVDLSQLAEQHQRDMPYLIQYFINSLGRDPAACADLMSYLLFTSKYTSALVEIGYNDASQRIDEIESFLYSSDDGGDRRLSGQRKREGEDKGGRRGREPKLGRPRPRRCGSSLRSLGRSFSFAPLGLALVPLSTHGLRPFDKARAGCGLHSCAASRLDSVSLVRFSDDHRAMRQTP